MIPSVADKLPQREDAPRSAAPPDIARDQPIRFADLLASDKDVAPRRLSADGDPATEDTYARVFNQDGFFGKPSAEALESINPVASDDGTAGHARAGGGPSAIVAATLGSALSSGAEDIPQALYGRQVLVRPSSLVSKRQSALVHDASGPAPGSATPIKLVFREAVGPKVVGRKAVPEGASPHDLQRRMSGSAFVAVAVHAIARGIDVAAHVAGLDDRERAALVDEIAALLSSHGYSPARVTVVSAAALPAKQEHR